MLILTRRRGQSVFIGENIVVKVIDIKGGSVQIGIDAPPDVHIARDDIKDPHPKDDVYRARPSGKISAVLEEKTGEKP